MTAAPIQSTARPAILTLDAFNGETCTRLCWELYGLHAATEAVTRGIKLGDAAAFEQVSHWKVEVRGSASARPTMTRWPVLTRPEARARAQAAAQGALYAERRELARLIVKALGPDAAELFLDLMARRSR